MNYNIKCESCDSEYKLIITEDSDRLEPVYCPFCAAEVDFESNDEDSEDDYEDDDLDDLAFGEDG